VDLVSVVKGLIPHANHYLLLKIKKQWSSASTIRSTAILYKKCFDRPCFDVEYIYVSLDEGSARKVDDVTASHIQDRGYALL